MKLPVPAIFCMGYMLLCQCCTNATDYPPLVAQGNSVHLDLSVAQQNETPENRIEIQLHRARAFRAALPDDLYQWTLAEPNCYAIILNEFLADYTPAHEFAAVNMIWSMAYNPNYSGDTFFADNDNESQNWTGAVQTIPPELPCGDNTVNIYFGTTTSDGINAQQPIALPLVEMLAGGITLANKQLPVTERIISIKIVATTNGSHVPQSNHSKKTALDIMSINGSDIVLDPFNPKVLALQYALDAQPNVRENFGPVFKHKTDSNGDRNTYVKIPGHFDHIHLSVQSP